METLELKNGVLLEVHNYHYRDYPEDDWSIKVIEETPEKAIEVFWKEKFVDSGITITSVYFSQVKYVEYEGKKIIVKEDDNVISEFSKLHRGAFWSSPLQAEAEAKRKEKELAKKKAQQEAYEESKRQDELDTLAKLKLKYPNN